MPHFPLTLPTDSEDVAWALSTAETLWKRGDHADALVWLKRAAEAASDSHDDDRALVLAREGAELREWLASRQKYLDSSMPPPDGDVDVELGDSPEAPRVGMAGARAGDSLRARAMLEDAKLPRFNLEESEENTTAVGAAPVRAMMATFPGNVAPTLDEAEVTEVTSLRAAQLETQDPQRAYLEPPTAVISRQPSATDLDAGAQAEGAPKPKGKKPPPLPPRAAVKSVVAEPAPSEPIVAAPVRTGSGSIPIPLPFAPPETENELPDADRTGQHVRVGQASQHGAPTVVDPVESRPPPPLISNEPYAVSPFDGPSPFAAGSPFEVPASPRLSQVETVEVARVEEALAAEPEASEATAVPDAPDTSVVSHEPVDLESIAAFGDLPDDSRAAFAALARVVSLAEGEEVPAGPLCLVLSGTLLVSAAVVDAPAATLNQGELASALSSIDAKLSYRLIGSSSAARVALWSEPQVEEAFRSTPWVVDELRALGDRLQAFCGITIGPLGERLDTELLSQVTSRLEVRAFGAGDIVLEKGAPVGFAIVGLGELVVGEGSTLSSGDFVYSERVLGGGAAPERVVAGAEGAVVLVGPRAAAQELLATVPPLVEVLAGI